MKAYKQIVEVFDNPDVVMTKFIQAMLDKVIQVSANGNIEREREKDEDRCEPCNELILIACVRACVHACVCASFINFWTGIKISLVSGQL